MMLGLFNKIPEMPKEEIEVPEFGRVDYNSCAPKRLPH